MGEARRRRRGHGGVRARRIVPGVALVAALATLSCGQVRDEPRSAGATPTPAPDGEAPVILGKDPVADSGGLIPDFCAGTTAVLHRIPGRVPCMWQIPTFDGHVLDPDKLNVSYEDNVGPRYLLTFAAVRGLSECDGSTAAGWYFDSMSTPTAIIGCPALCEFAGAVDGGLAGQFTASIGCSLAISAAK